jgi:hypothetical protein
MSETKYWQCPRCPQDSARRWNMVVHIRRWHIGMGRPVDKRDLIKNGHTFPSDLDRQHIFTRPSPKPCKTNRIFANGPIDDGGEGGDMIEEIHKIVTEMEEKRRKVEEIIAILQKYCYASSTPSVERNSIFSKNVVQSAPPTVFCRKNPDPKPPMLTHNSWNNVAVQKSTTQELSSESTSRNTKKWWSIRTIYLVDPKDNVWSETRPQKPTWVCKLNLLGDIIDAYNVSDDQ